MTSSPQPSTTPPPPYYAAIFTSLRKAGDQGYSAMADRMVELAKSMPGFLGVDSVRDSSGLGITVSYWESLDAIKHWQQNAEHLQAQELGKTIWYETFTVRIAKVERAYGQHT